MVVGLWVKVMSGDGANVACLSVRHSSSEPGGGVPLVESEMEGDALGTPLGGIDCMLWSIFGAGVWGAQMVAMLQCMPPMEGVQPQSDPDPVICCW